MPTVYQKAFSPRRARRILRAFPFSALQTSQPATEFIEDTEAVQKLGKLSKSPPLAHQGLVVSARAEAVKLPRAEWVYQGMKNWGTEKQCMLRRVCNLIMRSWYVSHLRLVLQPKQKAWRIPLLLIRWGWCDSTPSSRQAGVNRQVLSSVPHWKQPAPRGAGEGSRKEEGFLWNYHISI